MKGLVSTIAIRPQYRHTGNSLPENQVVAGSATNVRESMIFPYNTLEVAPCFPWVAANVEL